MYSILCTKNIFYSLQIKSVYWLMYFVKTKKYGLLPVNLHNIRTGNSNYCDLPGCQIVCVYKIMQFYDYCWSKIKVIQKCSTRYDKQPSEGNCTSTIYINLLSFLISAREHSVLSLVPKRVFLFWLGETGLFNGTGG